MASNAVLTARRVLITRFPGLYFHLRNAGRKVAGTRRRQRMLFADIVGEGDLVFDVGANIGEFTAAFRDLGARVVAIEPQSRLARHLRRRFRADDNVTVVAVAISDHAGDGTLFTTAADALATLEAGRATGSGTSTMGFRWDGRVRVPLCTLDTLVAEHHAPAFVKIDVEGHEPSVLRGLTACRPSIFFEVNQPDASAIIGLLAQRGYTDFYIRHDEEGDWVTRRPMTEDESRRYLETTDRNSDCLAVSPDAGARTPRPRQ